MRSRQKILLVISLFVMASLGCGLLNLPSLRTAEREQPPAPSTDARTELVTPIALPPIEIIPTAVPQDLITEADAEELLLINLYERVNPSVVNIEVTIGGDLPDDVEVPEEFGPFNPRGQGSGFVHSRDGYIVTNNHVVDGAEEVLVTFYNGVEMPAEIVGTDPDSDLAVLKVDVAPESLLPVEWGDSGAVVVGQRAVAIGNPFGLEGSLTTGIVSGLGRSLLSLNRSFRIPEVIQTDAAINPGNSGGPLLNSRGQVIGVNSAIVPRQVGFGERSFLGVGFAVPSNLAQRVIPALIEQGYYEHPWLGISASDVTTDIARAMNLAEARGTLVVAVLPGTPASRGGLQGGDTEFTTREGLTTQIGGDIIIAIDGEDIRNFDDLISYLSREGEVGQTITATIVRDGEIETVEIVLEGRPRANEFSNP